MEKQDAITGLAALAQESRLDVFRLLVQAGPEGLPAGQIAERLGVPANWMSPLLVWDDAIRSVTVIAEPVSPRDSAQAIRPVRSASR